MIQQPALSSRLSAIAGWVPTGARVADIGTDHGLLPVWLLLHGGAARVIATDLRAEPLNRARQTAARFDAERGIEFRLCDGLRDIRREEVDTIVIAGMGGENIADILAAAPWTREGCRLILQPMSKQPELRSWLINSGYVIFRERLARERGRIQTIMLAGGGESSPMTPAQLYAGAERPEAEEPGLPAEYLDGLIKKAERALGGLTSSGRNGDAAKADWYHEVLGGLAGMKEEWSK